MGTSPLQNRLMTIQVAVIATAGHWKKSPAKKSDDDQVAVIASGAKQSGNKRLNLDCFVHFDRFDKLTDHRFNAPPRNEGVTGFVIISPLDKENRKEKNDKNEQ